MTIESVMPSNHLILCRPLLLLPSIFPGIRVFSNELALHIRWPKYWSISFSISPSSEYSEPISFRIDWFDLLAVQGTARVFSNRIVQKHHSLALSFHHDPSNGPLLFSPFSPTSWMIVLQKHRQRLLGGILCSPGL